ncbi:hypothetical protein ACROYT_G035812 [Oculina patagonica]
MASSTVLAAKRKDKGSGSSDSDISSPEGKKLCQNSPKSDSISVEAFTDESATARNMEKITTQLEAILSRLDSVETKLGKLEGLFERLENVEVAVSKNRTELDHVNEKTKVIQSNVAEIEKGIVFANSQIEDLKEKDDENTRKIKELEDKLLYQEVYSRRENVRFFGIPEATQDQENTAEVLHKFFRDELNIPDSDEIEFQRVHRLGKRVQGQTRPIIARFLRFQERGCIFKSVRELGEAADTDVKVYADFPEEIRRRRKLQWPKMKKAREEDSLNFFLENPEIPKLTADDAQICEGKFTVAECFKSLQLFKNNKSPGEDGLTVEFYVAFWNIVGNLMVESLNYSYDHGELSSSQKRAIITLIEKKDKDRRVISNWRPISLINVDVKIGSKAIAKRLEAVLPNIIHHNQSAYVKDRTICDAFNPPHNRLNTEFFKIKPTLRELTSQHPYAEAFIGKPHVFTVDINNLTLVEETIKEILNTEVKPYLPLEWTPKGMLERVNAFTEYYVTYANHPTLLISTVRMIWKSKYFMYNVYFSLE